MKKNEIRLLVAMLLATPLACNFPGWSQTTGTPPSGTSQAQPPTDASAAAPPAPTPEPDITLVLTDNSNPISAIYYANPDGAEVSRAAVPELELLGAVVGGENVFFGDYDQLAIGVIDAGGAVRYLDFTAQPTGFTNRYLPSPDGQFIAWSTLEITSFNDPIQATAQLRLARADGANQVVVAEEQNQSDRIYKPVQWQQANRALFASHEPYGIGGYILFGIHLDLTRYDLDTGASTQILSECDCDLGISPDGTRVAYIQGAATDLVLLDVTTGQRRVVTGSAGHSFAGAIVFSPDGSRLAYSEAVGNPDAEMFAVYVVDFAGGVKTTVIADDARQFRVRAWPLANLLILESEYDPDTGDFGVETWTMRADGSGLAKTFPGKRFLGLWPPP